MLEQIKESTIPVLDLNMSTLAVFQAIDFSRLHGDYRDFYAVCQHLLEVTENERDRLKTVDVVGVINSKLGEQPTN